MIKEPGIDYQGLPYKIQRKLDGKAYAKYYHNFSDDYEDSEDVDDFSTTSYNKSPLSFNSWYGTDLHKRGILPFLRKYKLEKLKKAVI